MSDLIYYKNGEETFRISPPTVGTKTPKTKLEVKKMTEPTDTEILEFLLNQFQAHNLKMNGESDWVFMNGGSRMNHLKGKTVRDAVITAMNAEVVCGDVEPIVVSGDDGE